jgi:hypothetical protein
MAILRVEGLRQLKNAMTSSEKEPAAFRLIGVVIQGTYRYLTPAKKPPVSVSIFGLRTLGNRNEILHTLYNIPSEDLQTSSAKIMIRGHDICQLDIYI